MILSWPFLLLFIATVKTQLLAPPGKVSLQAVVVWKIFRLIIIIIIKYKKDLEQSFTVTDLGTFNVSID